MKDKPLPKFSRLDKVVSVLEATAGVGCAVIIVRGIRDRRWKRLYTALVVSGACLDAFGFLKGMVLDRRHSHDIEADIPIPAPPLSSALTGPSPNA